MDKEKEENKDIQSVKELTDQVDGWLTVREGRALYETVRDISVEGGVVEIGSWQGKSTIWLAKGAAKNERSRTVYAIDPHTGASEQQERMGEVWTYDVFKQNIEDARVDNVKDLVMTSKEAYEKVPTPLSFVFVDGAHEYEMVKLDFELWSPRIVLGGKIAFHDTNGRPGPTRVVREEIYFSSNFKNIKLYDSITIATKTDSISIVERIKKLLLFIYRELTILFTHRIRRLMKMIKWHIKKLIKNKNE